MYVCIVRLGQVRLGQVKKGQVRKLDILSIRHFVALDILSIRHFVHQTFCRISYFYFRHFVALDILSLAVLSLDILSVAVLSLAVLSLDILSVYHLNWELNTRNLGTEHVRTGPWKKTVYNAIVVVLRGKLPVSLTSWVLSPQLSLIRHRFVEQVIHGHLRCQRS